MLEIEKKFNIVVNLPQTCVLCFEEITKKNGKDSDSLCFHSLDDDHDNWSWNNKVPMHFGCHVRYHTTGIGLDRSAKMVSTIMARIPKICDKDRLLHVISLIRSKNKPATKTRIMQTTGWKTDKTTPLLGDMVSKGIIKALKVNGNKTRTYVHYVEAKE